MMEDLLYSVDELAERAGVSRRTVRYYVQRGLLPAPHGLGRGRHYGAAHLATLVRIRALQEAGVGLEAIAERLGDAQAPAAAQSPRTAPPRQASWTRVLLAEGVELHLRDRRLSDEDVDTLMSFVERMLGKASS